MGLTTVGRLLGHRKRRTTAIYAHLDDAALRDTAAQAAGVIATAMGYRAEPPPLPDETDAGGASEVPDTPPLGDARAVRPPSPMNPAAGRDRSEWDWEYGVSAQSTSTRPHGRPDRTPDDAAPGANSQALAEAARRTGFVKI